MDMQSVIDELLDSENPSIRYKIRVNVIGEDPLSPSIRSLQMEIKQSDLVAELLNGRDASGRIAAPPSVYSKWQGAHWIMATLADIGYPPGDMGLAPIRDQLQEHWLSPTYYCEFAAGSRAAAYQGTGVPVMQSRHRRCASQQSNALWSILKLGLSNELTHDFAERLLHWQWPDGGWNCDKNPDATHSSFMESILPLRALALYGTITNSQRALDGAKRASEIFLKRNLFTRQRDGSTMRKEFMYLHYPLYWHYDILHGLKVMTEAGFIDDPRCEKALDLLVSKRLPDGGWPAEKKYYRAPAGNPGNELVDWGGTSARKMNPWVTADALFVLRSRGRLEADPEK